MSIFDQEPNQRRAVMLRAGKLRRQGHDQSSALKTAWAELRQWKVMAKLCADVEMAARCYKTNCDELERQSFFLQRREDLKELRRLKAFKRARANAGNLSTFKERAWAATDRQGGRMTNGESWERHEIKKEVAA